MDFEVELRELVDVLGIMLVNIFLPLGVSCHQMFDSWTFMYVQGLL